MSTVFEVEEIIDTAIINNEPHYLIKWVGYGHEFDTWEPISQLATISDYLQHWLSTRRAKAAQGSKEKKKVLYEKIKPYLESGYARPAKKTSREKYAQEILKKKKTWEKYIGEEERSKQNEQAAPERKSKRLEKLIQPIPKSEEPTSIEAKQTLLQEEIKREEGAKEESKERKDEFRVVGSDEFRVVGSVSPAVIARILRLFIWRGVRCVEVELINGRRCNMREEEVKHCSPLMLLQFLEGEGLDF